MASGLEKNSLNLNLDVPPNRDDASAEESELPQSPEPTQKYKRGKGKATASKSTSSVTMQPEQSLDLNIILKFIKPFDGSRDKLNSFIINCNNAIELANNFQEPILFKYILSQLQGKAETACSIKEFANWEQLKDFLKNQFSERKHYSHLLMELQEAKQGPNENVSQFCLRVETCLSQLLTEISLSNKKVKELPGRTAAMEDLALHHFVMGLHPKISNIIRSTNPRSLNEAVNLAISEERIQLTLYKKSSSLPSEAPRRSYPNNIQPRPVTQRPSYGSNELLCRYCKSLGHTIESCKRREYNNARFNNSRPNFSSRPQFPNSSFPSRNQPSTSNPPGNQNRNFNNRVFTSTLDDSQAVDAETPYQSYEADNEPAIDSRLNE